MKIQRKLFVLLALFTPIFVLPSAEATTYFVDQGNGAADDNNAGTHESLPWRTLTKATKTVLAGDTVIVKAGNYVDLSAGSTSMKAFQLSGSGTASSPIVFRSEPRGAAVIGRHISSGPAWGISSREYIVLDGFLAQGAIGFREGSHNTIKNCEVINGSIIWADTSLHWGIYLQNSNNGLIENNYVHDMDDSGSGSHNTAGVMVFGSSYDSIIQHNTVDGNQKKVYNAYGTKGGGMDRCIWRYNTALNSKTGFMGMGSTNGVVSVNELRVYQNIIINCSWGMELYKNANKTEFYNNTIYGVERGITVADATCNELKVWNNIINSSDFGLIRFAGYNGSNAFSNLFEYSDYNDYSGNFGQFAFRENNRLIYATLSDWRTAEGFDSNSVRVAPNYINAGGMTSSDYKRTTYPTDGRGSPYHSVKGAYISGTEKIGYDSAATGPIRTAGSPSGEQVEGTTQVTISLTTDINSTCKYGEDGVAGTEYDALANTFATTGSTHHSSVLLGLTNGTNYSRAVRCKGENEANITDFVIEWSVANSSKTIRADVDLNLLVNSVDAFLTNRNVQGLNMANTDWKASATTGDVNCDETTDLVDVRLILRRSLELETNSMDWCGGN